MSDTRAQKGLHHTEKALRAQYVLHADFLLGDSKQRRFASAVKNMQRDWGRDYPGSRAVFAVDQIPQPSDGNMLEAMGFVLFRVLEIARSEDDQSSVEAVDRMIREWHERCLALAHRFWPPENFPNPKGDKRHLAFWFVDACLTYGPDRLGNWVEPLFPEIIPEATFDAFVSILWDDVVPLRGTGLAYDGMSDKFRVQGSAQVEAIRSLVRPPKTTEDRVRELREEHGLSQDSTAEAMGLTSDAVRRLSPGRSSNPRKDV